MPVAIGLQHATLNWEDPSCHYGPARHTERRESQLIEEDDEGQEDDDEGGEGEEGEEGEGGGEESDIKSNNPHLTGGEKKNINTSICPLSLKMKKKTQAAKKYFLPSLRKNYLKKRKNALSKQVYQSQHISLLT